MSVSDYRLDYSMVYSIHFSFRYILLLLVLFAIPGVVMIVAYGLISRELYRGIQFEMGHKKDSTGEAIHNMRKKQSLGGNLANKTSGKQTNIVRSKNNNECKKNNRIAQNQIAKLCFVHINFSEIYIIYLLLPRLLR